MIHLLLCWNHFILVLINIESGYGLEYIFSKRKKGGKEVILDLVDEILDIVQNGNLYNTWICMFSLLRIDKERFYRYWMFGSLRCLSLLRCLAMKTLMSAMIFFSLLSSDMVKSSKNCFHYRWNLRLLRPRFFSSLVRLYQHSATSCKILNFYLVTRKNIYFGYKWKSFSWRVIFLPKWEVNSRLLIKTHEGRKIKRVHEI